MIHSNVDELNELLLHFDYSISTRIIDMLFTPVINFSIFFTSPYQEQCIFNELI